MKLASTLETRSQTKIAEVDELGNDLLLSRLNTATSESDSDIDIAVEDNLADYPYWNKI